METKHKKVAKNGSLTIPKTMRAEAGIHPGTVLDVVLDNDNRVILTPHVPVCRCCGSAERVRPAMDMDICAVCADKIHKAVVSDE